MLASFVILECSFLAGAQLLMFLAAAAPLQDRSFI